MVNVTPVTVREGEFFTMEDSPSQPPLLDNYSCGHIREESNTYTNPKTNKSSCRECIRIRSRKRYHSNKNKLRVSAPTCINEECNKQAEPSHSHASGYRYECKNCRVKRNRHDYFRTLDTRKLNPCVKCGFTPDNQCQIDWDHIDGDHSNNSKDNLQLLCANCHRLKTHQNKDWEDRSVVS